MATAECRFSSGLNSSSGGELKLYLGCTGSTNKTKLVLPILALESSLYENNKFQLQNVTSSEY